MLKPRGQTGLEAKNLASALASSFWPRPRPRPRNSMASASRFWPRPRPRDILATTAGHRSFRSQASMNRPNNFCATSPTSTLTLPTTLRLSWQLYCDFSVLQPLFDRLFCIPASSAPVESFLAERYNYDSSPGTHVYCCAWVTGFPEMQCRLLVAELNSSATKCLHCISGKPVTQAQHSIRLFSITSGL